MLAPLTAIIAAAILSLGSLPVVVVPEALPEWVLTFVPGVVLEWLRGRTGSLVPGALAHLTLTRGLAIAIATGWAESIDSAAAAIGLCGFALLWVYRDRSARSDAA